MIVYRFPIVQRKALPGREVEYREEDGRLVIRLGRDFTRREEDREIAWIVQKHSRLTAIPLLFGLSVGRARAHAKQHPVAAGAAAVSSAAVLAAVGWVGAHEFLAGDESRSTARPSVTSTRPTRPSPRPSSVTPSSSAPSPPVPPPPQQSTEPIAEQPPTRPTHRSNAPTRSPRPKPTSRPEPTAPPRQPPASPTRTCVIAVNVDAGRVGIRVCLP